MENFFAILLSRISFGAVRSGEWLMNFFAGILNLAEDFARPSKKDIDEIRRQQKLDNEQLLEHQNSHPSSGLE